MACSCVSQTKVIKVLTQEYYRWLEGLNGQQCTPSICVFHGYVWLCQNEWEGMRLAANRLSKCPQYRVQLLIVPFQMYFAFTPPFFPQRDRKRLFFHKRHILSNEFERTNVQIVVQKLPSLGFKYRNYVICNYHPTFNIFIRSSFYSSVRCDHHIQTSQGYPAIHVVQ